MMTINDPTKINNSGPFTLAGGTTLLGLSLHPSSAIAAPLVLSGGTLAIQGNNAGASSLAFSGGTTISTGGSSITIDTNSGSGTSLALGAITRTGPTATMYTFFGSSTFASVTASIYGNGTVDFANTGTTTTTSQNTSGTILGGWATVAGSDWAVSAGTGNSAGPITALGSYQANDFTAASNDVTVTASSSPASGFTVNSLRFAAAGSLLGGYTLNLSGANTIASGGILLAPAAGPFGATIAGSGSLSANFGTDLVVHQFDTAGTLRISAPIIDNAGTGLTKSGPGTLVLTGANTYTGPTTINAGVLSLSSDGIGSNQPGTLGSTLNAATPGNLVLDGGTLQATGTFTVNSNRGVAIGPTSGGGDGVFEVTSNGPVPYVMTVAGVISNNGISPNGVAGSGGVGRLVKTGPGTLFLTGGNSYSGGAVIEQGILAVNGSGALGSHITSAPWVTFAGANTTLQMLGAFGTGPAYTIDIGTGVTATIDDVAGVNFQMFSFAHNQTRITGAGSINFISTSGNAEGNVSIANQFDNDYTGNTTVYDTGLSLGYAAITDALSMKLNASGVLSLGGNMIVNVNNPNSAPTVETIVSSTNLIPNYSSIIYVNAGTSSPAAGTTIRFAGDAGSGAFTRAAGGTVVVAWFNGGSFVPAVQLGSGVTNAYGTTNKIIGGWATVGSVPLSNIAASSTDFILVTDWAVVNGSGYIAPLASAGYTNDAWAAGNNTKVTGDSVQPSGSTTNSLKLVSLASSFGLDSEATVTLSGANTVASGGILVTTNWFSKAGFVSPTAAYGTDTSTFTITGGSLTSGNGTDLIVNQFNTSEGSPLIMDTKITGAIGLTLTGNAAQIQSFLQTSPPQTGGYVILTQPNDYTGPTAINARITLQVGPGAGQVIGVNTISGVHSAVVLSQQATLDLNGNNQAVGSLSASAYGGGFGTTVSNGSATTPVILTIGDDNTSTAFNGSLRDGGTGGTLALVKIGSGTLTLGNYGGTNNVYANFNPLSNYSGGTTINAGTISISSDGNLGATSGGLIINGTAAAPSTLQSTASFTSARGVALGTNNSTSGGTIDVVSGQTLNLSGILSNASGGTNSLTKVDSGTLFLTNAGNAYSGGTFLGTATNVGGILEIGADGALGATSANPNVTFANTSTLQLASGFSGAFSSSRNFSVLAGVTATIDTNGNNITGVGGAAGTLLLASSATLVKTDSPGAPAGVFTFAAVPSLANNSQLQVNSGTLRFNASTGSATIGSNVTATIASGATLELAGTVSALGAASGSLAGVVAINNNSGGAGTTTGGLHVTGANQQVGAVTGSGNTVVESGASLTAYQIVQNSLTINGTDTVTLSPSGSGSATNPAAPNNITYSSNVHSLSIGGTMNAWTGKLDIGNNGLVVQYGGGADPFATLVNMVHSGYANGNWTGTGITSSLARAAVVLGSPTPALNIGLIDFVPNGPGFGSSIVFEGQTITTSAVLVRLTYMDDLVLAGDMAQANATSDALFFAANYGSGTIWHVGDITHDGVIDTNDALLFAANYVVGLPSLDGTTGNAAALGGNSAAVPEPATLVLAAAGLIGFGAGARSGRARSKR